MQYGRRANHTMAQNPCLKLYEIVKKQRVDRRVFPQDHPEPWRDRSVLKQERPKLHHFETLAGTTKLTI